MDGYFIDVFTLLKPEGEAGKTGTKRDKKGTAKGATKRNFQNWLLGYIVYMTLMDTAFPEWAWHFINHFNNMLKSRVLVRELPVINYDETFHQRVYHNELACWDLRNSDIWLETVGPHGR